MNASGFVVWTCRAHNGAPVQKLSPHVQKHNFFCLTKLSPRGLVVTQRYWADARLVRSSINSKSLLTILTNSKEDQHTTTDSELDIALLTLSLTESRSPGSGRVVRDSCECIHI